VRGWVLTGERLVFEIENLTEVCEIARKAGAAIMDIYEGVIEVEMKGDATPLTTADQAAHSIIATGLQELYPDIPLLSEEGKSIPFDERKAWRQFWLVDPLDGTKEFIKRNGEFTVNIALIEDGFPTAGVVHLPAIGKTYYGAKGEGAWLKQGDAPPVPIHPRILPAGAGLAVVMSRSHPSSELDDYLKNIDVAESVSVGSSLKFCTVAEGKADLYPRLGPTMEWDTAAGQAIVESAGGKVVDLAGNQLRYNKKELLNSSFIVSA
jgi:3'(2'), 5'-bisphosphate nucleotidase